MLLGMGLALQSGSLLGSSGGGGDEPLAVIDFQAGTNTNYLSGGGYTTDDISPSNGWFPQTRQSPVFGAALNSIFADAAGLIIVVDLVNIEAFETAITCAIKNADASISADLSVRAEELGLNLTVAPQLDTMVADYSVRSKFGLRLSPSDVALCSTDVAEDNVLPDPGAIDAWVPAQSFIEVDGEAWKIFSIKFYAADADLAALVA